MPQQTLAQARVIDPILTTVAQGYRNAAFIGSTLFPAVPVDQRGGKIVAFGKEDFMIYRTARAPGAHTPRVQFGYSSNSYALEQHALEGQVPFEQMQDARQVPGIDQGQLAVRKVQNIIGLRLEKAQADLATTAGNYPNGNKATLSGTAQWSDYTNSNPSAAIETAKDAIRAKIGLRPNVVVLGAAVFSTLRQHPAIIDRIKYTGRDVVTTELLAALWGVDRVVVGDAVYASDAGVFSDVWGKFVVVAYTDTTGLMDMGVPTFGYSYQLRGYPVVERPYEDRNAKSWIYPVTDEVAPVIAANTAGYLYSAVVP